MSYTLSFVSVTPGKEDGESFITIQVNGDIANFVPQGYSFAINGTPVPFGLNDDGTATFTVDTNSLPVTFTIVTAEGATVPGSQLVAPPTESSSSGGLSDGAIIVIILGSIVGLILIYYYSYIKYFNLG